MQSTLVRIALIAAALLAAPVAVADAQDAPRVVNVTPDSAPGWVPSPELEATARKTALAYLAARDAGDAKAAYGMEADLQQKDTPFAAYVKELRAFNDVAGAVKERRIVFVTWTKDPANAPGPGVYAAIDLVSRFTGVDRYCGYLMLWQSPAGGDFKVMREEGNFISNDTAGKLKPDVLEQSWAALTSRCPNYPGKSAEAAAAQGPLPEMQGDATGYPSVAAALKDLRSQPKVTFSTVNGWTVATDEPHLTVWSFAPKGDASYPSVVKRQVVVENGQTNIVMRV